MGLGVNSTINAINAGQDIPPRAVMPRVKNALLHNLPYQLPHKIPQPPITPVRADRLEALLNGYPFQLKDYILPGFNLGFHVHFEGERRVFEPPNLKSACSNEFDNFYETATRTKTGKFTKRRL